MAGSTEAQLQRMANKLRAHALRMTTAAGSGHPSTCCSMAEIMAVLFFDQMRYDPQQPTSIVADQFVLSKGHAAPIWWAALHEAGALREDLLSLRKITSPLEGHPTPLVPWVRVATGSLGQGLSAGCGIAIAQKKSGIDAQVYVVLGDGEVAEGAVWEAAQFAGHYRLHGLCAIVDLNRLGQSGESYFRHDAERLAQQWASMGWDAQVVDGHDVAALRAAFGRARAQAQRPSVLIAKTLKGKGVSLCEDKAGWHGKPLSAEQLTAALAELGDCDVTLPAPACRLAVPTPTRAAAPVAPVTYRRGDLIATREAYGHALVRLARANPRVIALDADTKNSTYSDKLLKDQPDRFVECFIAEQNMVGVALGLASMGWIPCASTFACFLSRAYDFIRMGVISRPPHLILCGSHAGVSIGQDGPSQMGLEDLAMIRTLVASTVVYPSDAVSTERLMEALLEQPGISYLRSTRPAAPVLYSNDEAFPIGGSKVLRSSAADICTIIGAGVTLHEALTAHELLRTDGIAIRVIDAYSIKPIDVETLRRAATETGTLITVEDHSAYGGLGDAVDQAVSGRAPVIRLAVNGIPRSGAPAELMAHFGIDAAAIVKAVQALRR